MIDQNPDPCLQASFPMVHSGKRENHMVPRKATLLSVILSIVAFATLANAQNADGTGQRRLYGRLPRLI